MISDDEKKKSKREKERERANKRYAEEPEYRAKKLARNDAYQKEHRDEIAARQRENRAATREVERKRYAEDPEYRARKLASNMDWYWRHRDGLNAQRREKRSSDAEFRERLIERQNERRHILVYRLSKADYDRMLIAQNGACAICKRKSKRRLCVDHCHVTGEVRGLICHKCNTALGLFDDDPERMVAASYYVRRTRPPDSLMIGAAPEQGSMPGVHGCIVLCAQVGRFGSGAPAIFAAAAAPRGF